VKVSRKTPGKGGQRWYKNVGLGFKTPKEAIEGEPPRGARAAAASPGSGAMRLADGEQQPRRRGGSRI
jgi:hypothetical protein